MLDPALMVNEELRPNYQSRPGFDSEGKISDIEAQFALKIGQPVSSPLKIWPISLLKC